MISLLKQNELQILEYLFDDLTKSHTVSSISNQINQEYAQTHRVVKGLEIKKLITLTRIGKSNQINLNLKKYFEEFIIIEVIRGKKIPLKIQKVISRLLLFEEQLCVVLFGSYANDTQKKGSDIDLLIICDDKVKLKLKNKLSLYDCDINFTTSAELLSMWNSTKINVGNEILKKHKILMGQDYFIRLLFQKYNN